MKRIYLSMLVLLCTVFFAQAGGIVTNTNQSAAWIRMLVRDASTDVDAVYYNPAALTLLENGFYVQANNQTAVQHREISNKYPFLNNDSYKGDIFVPTLPTAYAVYKKDKLALFGAFVVVGGGGGATYPNGLPSFEIPISNIPAGLRAAGIPTTKYGADVMFSGTSVYYGFEVGGAYKLNDWLSVALGFRYNAAKNTYLGHIRNIMIDPNYPAFGAAYTGGLVSAPKFFSDAKTTLTNLALGATGYSTALAGISGKGAGSSLISAVGLPTADVQNIQAMVAAAGGNVNNITVDYAKNVLGQAAPVFQAKANAMAANAAGTADKEVDVTQTGASYTPIFGVNLNLLQGKLDIGVKYEMKSSMKVKNKVTRDDTYTKADKSDAMFPEGAEVSSDIPGLLTVGVKYSILPNLRAQAGFHYYFDRDADYGRVSVDDLGVTHTGNAYFLDSNSKEAALGLEFDINDKLALSVGYLYTTSSPTLAYQSDLSYSLNSHSIGFGGVYKLSPKFSIDLGIMYTSYTSENKDIIYNKNTASQLTAKETYTKDNVIGSIGLTYKFGN